MIDNNISVEGKKQNVIKRAVASTLNLFCEQEPEFEQAIEQSGKSFQDCLDFVVKGVGTSISDFDVYSKAVEFYFPGAKVHFDMRIDLIGDAAPPILVSKRADAEPKSITAEIKPLDDLLDF